MAQKTNAVAHATREGAPFDLADNKNQQRPRRQDHEDDEVNGEINAARTEVFEGKIGPVPNAKALNRRDIT